MPLGQFRSKDVRPVKRTAVRGASRQIVREKRRLPWLGMLKLISVCLLLAALGFALKLAWPYVAKAVDRPIEHVRVDGDFQHMQTADLQAILEPYMHGSFFDVDLEQMQDTLLTHPWVESAALRRVWPASIEVNVEEQVPSARWNEKFLLNTRGEMIAVGDNSDYASFALLKGPKGSELKVMQRYQLLSQLLRPTGLVLSALFLTDRGAWVMQTENFSLLVGTNNVLEKIERFKKVFNQRLKNKHKEIASVDLRYINGVSVAWKEQVLN